MARVAVAGRWGFRWVSMAPRAAPRTGLMLFSESDTPMAAKVRVENLRKSYGSTAAADGVSFEIAAGEIFALIGPNGAGKTTTLECVIGLREPDEGRIEVCGIDARRRPHDVKQKIGAALQTSVLQDKITPREALTLFGAFYRDREAPEATARAVFARRQGRRAVRFAVGRPAAAARARAGVRQQARARVSRRAHRGARSTVAARAARRDRADEGRRPHGAAHDALSRRGRGAVRSHRHHRSRPHRRHRQPARAGGRIEPGGGRHLRHVSAGRGRLAGVAARSARRGMRGHERAAPQRRRQTDDRRIDAAVRGARTSSSWRCTWTKPAWRTCSSI